MRIVHMNVGSIEFILNSVQQSDPDIFVFSETWLSNKVENPGICLDNCSVFQCGRTIIYISYCLSVLIRYFYLLMMFIVFYIL